MIGVFIDPGYRPPVPCGPCYKRVSIPPGISLDKADLALLSNVEKAGVYGIRIWELLNRVADEENPATRAETRALRLKLWQNLRKLLSRGVVFRRARSWISVYRLPRASVGLGIGLGVCITFGLIYRFGHSFFKRMDLEERGPWDQPLAEPIPKDKVVAVYKRRKRYHRHNRHYYQHRRPRQD